MRERSNNREGVKRRKGRIKDLTEWEEHRRWKQPQKIEHKEGWKKVGKRWRKGPGVEWSGSNAQGQAQVSRNWMGIAVLLNGRVPPMSYSSHAPTCATPHPHPHPCSPPLSPPLTAPYDSLCSPYRCPPPFPPLVMLQTNSHGLQTHRDLNPSPGPSSSSCANDVPPPQYWKYLTQSYCNNYSIITFPSFPL